MYAQWSLMQRVKGRVQTEKELGIVYALGCGDCANVYIGETSHTAEQRKKEHQAHVKHGPTELSAVVAHTYDLEHRTHWKPRIVKKEMNLKKTEDSGRPLHQPSGEDRQDNESRLWH